MPEYIGVPGVTLLCYNGLPMSTDREHNGAKPPFAFISRYIPLAVIAVLLLMLIPTLTRSPRDSSGEAGFEPPLVLTLYSTQRARMDSLSNAGLRCFSAEEWNGAVRLLGEAHFHYTVMVREGFEKSYPEDLRFYLGLSHYFRGQAEKGIELLVEEAEDDPLEPKYYWYLALIRLSAGDTLAAGKDLEHIVRLGEEFSEEASELLRSLPDAAE